MAKHPTSSRVRREDHGPDDAFVATVKRTYAWGRENARVVGIALVVVLLVIAGGIWYMAQQRQLETQAAARLGEVHQTVATGNAELAIRDLERYLERFGGTRTADQARLLLASILLGENRPQEAREALGNLPRNLDRPFGMAAARLDAAALEEAGDFEAAADTYRRIAADARFTYERREALADAARVSLQNGDPAAAARLYERVVETFAQDDQGRGYYEMWLAEARARTDNGLTAASAPGAPAPQGDPEG